MKKILSETQIATKRGCPVLLEEISDRWARWRVEYRGAGHYFRTLSDAVEYCKKRNFLKKKG